MRSATITGMLVRRVEEAVLSLRYILLGASLCGVILANDAAHAATVAAKFFQPQKSGLNIVVLRDVEKSGRRVAVLNETWLYCSPDTNKLYAVPRGYVTDFASIPRFAKLFFPPFDKWAEAAVIHDWTYDVAEIGKREEADQVFNTALREAGVGALRRGIMVSAVRLGGGRSYGRAEKRDPEVWRAVFAGRTGEAIDPPFEQPSTAVFMLDFDCEELDSVEKELREQFDKDGFRALYSRGLSVQPQP